LTNQEAPAGRRHHRKGVATRAKILRVAERMFAEHGLDGVSLREITAAADVELASVNYHFRSKDRLFEIVVAQRADIISAARERALKRLSEPPVPGEIIDAFLAPVFVRLRRSEQGWRHYGALVAQVMNSARFADFHHEHTAPTLELFVAALSRAYPGVSRAKLYWGYFLLVGALVRVLVGADRLGQLSHGDVDVYDLNAVQAELRTFCLGGLEALARD
jgi:AcrR family transcriptional regulator